MTERPPAWRRQAAAIFGWVAAIAAFITILDICVETLLAASPLRWIVLLAGIGFFAITVLLWKLNRPHTKAELGLIAVAAIVTYAGLNGGLTDPQVVRAYGNGASALAAALIIVVLTIAASAFAVQRRVAIWLRAIVTFVALYAVIPLAMSLGNGGLIAALNGSVPGIREPFWLRGAYIAVTLLLPLTVIGFTFAVARRLVARHARASLTAARGALAAILCLQIGVLQAADARLPSLARFELGRQIAIEAPPQASTSAAPQEQPAATKGLSGALADATDALSPQTTTPRRRVNAFLAKIATAAKYVHRETFDPVALAATLPADPKASFTFVRDAISNESYSGAMRGAQGALMTRGANPDDKALLLAALLKAKSIEVRFASASLSADDVNELRNGAQPPPAESPEDVPDAFYTELGLAKADVDQRVAADAATNSQADGAAIAFADAHAPELWQAIARRAPSAASPSATPPPETQHVYLQANVGGQWVDLDPSLRRLDVGAHLGAATVGTQPLLPAERYHVVRARFVLSYGTGSSATATTVLERQIRSADAAEVPVKLGIYAPGVKAPSDAANARTFKAFIDVGTDALESDAFTLRDAVGRQLASARLELRSSSPGQPARTYTRVFYDAVANAEPALAICHSFDALIVSGDYNRAFSDASTLAAIAALKPLLIYTATPTAERTPLTPRDLALPFPMQLLAYARREARIAQALQTASSANLRFRFERPNIVMLSSGFERGGSQVRATTGVDIVENGRAATADTPDAARLANVKRGILDTFIEQHVLRFLDPAGFGAPQIFQAASNARGSTVVVASADAPPRSVSVISADALRETNANGQVALALQAPLTVRGARHYAWWAIDPATGDTVGRIDNGAGAEMAEESALLYYAKRVGMAFTILGCIIAGPSCGEDYEASIILGGSLTKWGVIAEAAGILKSVYDMGGGTYGNGPGPDSEPQGGQSQAGSGGSGGTSNQQADPGTGGSSASGPGPDSQPQGGQSQAGSGGSGGTSNEQAQSGTGGSSNTGPGPGSGTLGGQSRSGTGGTGGASDQQPEPGTAGATESWGPWLIPH